MTRHNLDSNIAWLLLHGVTPRPDVHATINASSIRAVEVLGEEDIVTEEAQALEKSRVGPLHSRRNRAISAVNVGQTERGFVRQSLPSVAPISSIANLPKSPGIKRTGENGKMGKLSTASRPARQKMLASQHQLATPASTTSTAAPSSLTNKYEASLEDQNDTPSSRTQSNRPLQTHLRNSHIPQTPQTPRQSSRPVNEPFRVETVDLTSDDYATAISRSGSSAYTVYTSPQVLWNEPSASRPEPLPRTSKKRKSDDFVSTAQAKRSDLRKTPLRNPKEDDTESMEGFVDIDDCTVEPPRLRQVASKTAGNRSLKTTIETDNATGTFQEELQITEVFRRTETRTRKSISRVPSISEHDHLRLDNSVQIAASPMTRPASQSMRPNLIALRLDSPSPRKSVSSVRRRTPEKPIASSPRRVIQDSEDDECMSPVQKQTSCSPRSMKKVQGAVPMSPKMKDIPIFPQTEYKGMEIADSKSRVGSPLRPISKNLLVRQESVPSPFQRDSPTQVLSQSKEQHRPLSQPNVSISPEDKKLVDSYLAQPSAINLYQQRITNLLAENSIAAHEFFDEHLPVPEKLKAEREALLAKKKAYEKLVGLADRHSSLRGEKKQAAKQMARVLDADGDASEQEERVASLSLELKNIEVGLSLLLHDSGAVNDGFGTESCAVATGVASSSYVQENKSLRPSGSSTIGSAQVIEQTQFPSLSRVSASTVSQNTHLASPVRNRSFTASTSVRDQASPSPVRQYRPTTFADYAVTRSAQAPSTPKRSFKHPVIDPKPQSVDYEFDEDEEAFEDLLIDEQEMQVESRRYDPAMEVEIPKDIEEDYDDSDIDEDMEDFAQEFEKRQSLPAHHSVQPKQRALPENIGSSERAKRGAAKPRKDMYSHVDLENSALFNHPWSNDVKKVLKERFKLRGFRHHQLEAINATLSGQDAFVLMPTGGGKSLCYQLPAVVQSGKTKGVTIVISPLLSLMNDQVEHLRKLNIRAATLNGETNADERRETLSHLNERNPEQYIQLLYITPEMVAQSGQMGSILSNLHSNRKLARFVIDEAHCVSQWGHDFRPDYVALSSVRKNYRGVPIMALTATATENVKVDVMHNLGMGKCPSFSQSFNRPNLYYEVRKKRGKGAEIINEMATLIKDKYRGQTGIIYTLSKKDCEDIASKLTDEHNINAAYFHAALEPERKKKVQQEWQSGKVQLVVATIAFGMGIDKADVRFVIHHKIPKSLEGYYQETGRAGRDGKQSGCYLLYGYGDTIMLKKFIADDSGSEEQKERQRKMLQRMIQYCEERAECRRVQVLDYFGEKFNKADCQNTCDNCRSDTKFKAVDFSQYAQQALHLVKSLRNRKVTLLHCVDILRGVSSQKIKSLGLNEIADFGVINDLNRGELERLFYRLVMENALKEDNVINKAGFPTSYLKLGSNWRPFLSGQRKIFMQIQTSKSPASRPKPAKSAMCPPSTMLTSPVSPILRKRNGKGPAIEENEDDGHGYIDEGFIIADDEEEDEYEDAFEKMQPPRRRQLEMRAADFGPPITADEQMDCLSDIHKLLIPDFLEEAKRLEEQLRNDAGVRRPFFTEAHLRGMAINWTLNLVSMKNNIPGINPERVQTYGTRFLPLIQKWHETYNEMMNSSAADRPIDPNHRNAIDLTLSDEEEGAYGSGVGSDAEAALESNSKYFPGQANPKSSGRSLPWQEKSDSAGKGKPRSGSGFSGRGRGGKRKSNSRRSYGSASGSGTSGVAKKRTSSGAYKKSRGKSTYGRASKSSDLTKKFGYSGGSGSGSGGGMIGMMPT